MIYYGNVYPVDKNDLFLHQNKFEDTAKELRVTSARLRASRDNIPFYGIIESTGLVLRWQNVEEAAIGFIGWSNELTSVETGKSGRQEYRTKIAKALNMKSY